MDVYDKSLQEMIEALELEQYVNELDETGLTVIPQQVLGLDDEFFESLRSALLRVAEQRTGARFDLAAGVSGEFESRTGEVGQFFLTHLIYEDPMFVRVLTHPVKQTLMRHMLGDRHRLSASNGWIKWQTPDTWNRPVTTAMHADQGQVPAPWDWRSPHVANMNWLLTDYTREDGAFAYVPGSHLEGRPPRSQTEAVDRAVPVEAPAGSLVMFQGGTWHGAFCKQTPGLRVSMHGLHCRPYYIPQQDFKGRIPETIYAQSDDPEYLRMLMREDEIWVEARVDGSYKVPRLKTND